MDMLELQRKLQSVGKESFVRYFKLYESYAQGDVSHDVCVKQLVSDQVSNANGAHFRCESARKIFEHHFEIEALGEILRSKRMSEYVIFLARDHLMNLKSP